MTMITPSYLGETIEYSSLHACRSTLEDPTMVVSTDTWLRVSTQSELTQQRGTLGNLTMFSLSSWQASTSLGGTGMQQCTHPTGSSSLPPWQKKCYAD